MLIGGIEFKVKKFKGDKLKKLNYAYDLIGKTNTRTLYDCYNKPSEAKQAIYKKWIDWWLETPEVHHIHIKSYNTNVFTLECTYKNDDVIGIINITPTKNEIYI